MGRKILRVYEPVPGVCLWGTPEPATKLGICSEFSLMREAALEAGTSSLKPWLNLLDKQATHQPAGSSSIDLFFSLLFTFSLSVTQVDGDGASLMLGSTQAPFGRSPAWGLGVQSLCGLWSIARWLLQFLLDPLLPDLCQAQGDTCSAEAPSSGTWGWGRIESPSGYRPGQGCS